MSVQVIEVVGTKPPTTDEALQLLRMSGYAGGRRPRPSPMAWNDKFAALVAAWRMAGKSAAKRAGFVEPLEGAQARFDFIDCYRVFESSTGMLVSKWLLDGFFDSLPQAEDRQKKSGGHWRDGVVASLGLFYTRNSYGTNRPKILCTVTDRAP